MSLAYCWVSWLWSYTSFILSNLDTSTSKIPSPPPSPPLTPRDPDITPEPYDEQAIVSSMTTIYVLLFDLQYLKPNEIVCPQPSGHAINLQLCKSLNLDERVISLIQQLPYPRNVEIASDFDIIEETRSLVYTDDEDVKDGRDPENAGTGEELRVDYLLPTDIALTCGGRYGKTLVLDTKENTIRTIDYYDWPSISKSMERPDEHRHYRNYLAEPAFEVLRRYAHRYQYLALIPRRYGHSLDRWDRNKMSTAGLTTPGKTLGLKIMSGHGTN